METYVVFFRYSAEAWEQMVRTPSDRSVAARRLIEAMGGSMESFYWMFGEWDGLAIFTVPDEVTAAAMNAGMLTSRVLSAVTTHRLVGPAQAEAALVQARAIRGALEPPGGASWYADYDAFVGDDS